MYIYVCGTISPLVLVVITKYDFYVKTSVIIIMLCHDIV